MNIGRWALAEIKRTTFQTLGCTDPVAVALAATTAYQQVPGDIEKIEIIMDRNIYKNAMYVGIPGTDRKGIKFAVALGIVGGKTEKGLLLLDGITEADIAKADDLDKKGLIELSLNRKAFDVNIRAKVFTSSGNAEALITGCHDNIVFIKKNGNTVETHEHDIHVPESGNGAGEKPDLAALEMADLFTSVSEITEEDLQFLLNGVTTNLHAADEGLKKAPGMGLGAELQGLMDDGVVEKNLVNKVKMFASAAADARMGGLKVPIIGVGGSGNHGITFFVTVGLASKNLNLPEGANLARSLALGILLLSIIKQYTGVLTPICGCAVAAGAGATASITHLLGGSPEQVVAAIKLLLGNLAGLVCDGAKYGCALKVGTSAGVSVESALLALRGVEIPDSDGIIGESLHETLDNLGILHKKGMNNVDSTILDIILKKEG